jgi:TolB-like protein
MAWGVAQVADLVLDNYGAAPWVMQVILVALGIGFPVALVLSWIFDLRWDGLHRESDLVSGIIAPGIPTQKVDHESIAVLPFVNTSSDPEQEYFSDGISEELLNLLARIKELTVIARTSSFSFKGADKPISEIGTILGVAYVLEGSVRKAGNRLRITAQLIVTQTSHRLWSVWLNPNYSRGYRLKAMALIRLGDPEAPVLSTIRKAVERDPASLVGLANLHDEYLYRLEFDRSEALLRQMAAIDPDSQWISYSRAATMMYKGEDRAALELLLANEVAFSNGIITSYTQGVATDLGCGEVFEAFNPAWALELYAGTGRLEDARRVGPSVAAAEGAKEDVEVALAVALWQSIESNHEVALSWLSPFDEADPDKWGTHFRHAPVSWSGDSLGPPFRL